MPSFSCGGATPTQVWEAAIRTLTAFDAAALGVPADVWAEATRVLTDISAEEIFDLPATDSYTPSDRAAPTSAASADGFGSWDEMLADVGTGKRLIAISVAIDSTAVAACEVEIGEGGSGSEAAVTRLTISKGNERTVVMCYCWRALTDNARLSARARDTSGSALTYIASPIIA